MLVIFFKCVVRHALPLRRKLVWPKPHQPYCVRWACAALYVDLWRCVCIQCAMCMCARKAHVSAILSLLPTSLGVRRESRLLIATFEQGCTSPASPMSTVWSTSSSMAAFLKWVLITLHHVHVGLCMDIGVHRCKETKDCWRKHYAFANNLLPNILILIFQFILWVRIRVLHLYHVGLARLLNFLIQVSMYCHIHWNKV